MARERTIILGAAGRDFHNLNDTKYPRESGTKPRTD